MVEFCSYCILLKMQVYGTIKGIDFDRPSALEVTSLQVLCANSLILYGPLSPAICRKLPQRFISILMRSAILQNSETVVAMLLNAWRKEVFNFEIVVSVTVMPYDFLEKQHFVPIIIHNVLKSVSENDCRIRCLDFSSVSIEGHVLSRVCGLLTDKDMFSQSENGSPEKECAEEQNTRNKFVIKINVTVNVMEELALLCQTLHFLNTYTALSLQITGIHLNMIHEVCKNILVLLDLVKLETDAFSCCLTFSLMYEIHNSKVIHMLRSFRNLKTLNITLDISPSEYRSRIFCELSDLFHELQNLEVLILVTTGNSEPFQISEFHRSESLSSKLSLPIDRLHSLQLLNCQIREGDFNVSSLPQDLTLKTLNLADSEVDLQSLVCLLTLCKSLQTLTISGCEFTGGNIDLLFQAFPAMKRLEHLDIMDIKISPEDLMSKVKYISRMPSLEYLSILPEEILAENISFSAFQEKFNNAVKKLWNCPSRNLRR